MASAGRKKKIEWFDIVVYAFLTVFALLIIIPFYNMLLVSFAGERTNNANPGMLFLAPSDFTLVNYKYVFDAPILFSGYLSTLYIVGLGTCTPWSSPC